ncbi:MAG: fimbria major subunit [Alistipes senegalensis]
MYYNIRIEHLNNSDETTEEGKTIIPEAKYGVVRNHHYVVTINSLSKPGTGY